MNIKIRLSYLSFILIFVITTFTYAEWNFVGGPEGLLVNDVQFLDSGRLIVSTYTQGFFYSDDFGESWCNSNIHSKFGSVYAIKQLLDSAVVAVTDCGLVKSDDSGLNWKIINSNSIMSHYNVDIHESPVDFSLFYGADHSFYKSVDGGETWNQILETEGVVDSYVIDYNGIIYVGVRYGTILCSTDGGITFDRIPIELSLNNDIVTQLMTNPSGGLYIEVYGGTCLLLHYENNLLTQMRREWCDPILCVKENGKLIYKCYNSIKEYDPVSRQSTVLSRPYFVKDQLAKNATSYQNVLVANFASEGIHCSFDGGGQWVDICNGLGYQSVQSIEICKRGSVFAGAFGYCFWGGLYSSENNGETFTRINPRGIDAYFVDISKLQNNGLIATGSYGVYLADEDGKYWHSVSGISLAYSQYVSNSGIIFVGDHYQGIFISKTDGKTWNAANNGIQHSYFFGFGESNSGRIFASAWPSGTYYSDDNGSNWNFISSGILSYNRTYDFQCKDDTLFAGISTGIAYSIDDGENWDRIGGVYGTAKELILAPNGDVLAAIQEKGVFKRNSVEKTWQLLGEGLEKRNVAELAFGPDYLLYAATDSGIFSTIKYQIKPKVVSPSNGDCFQSDIVNIYWKKAISADYYCIEISEDSTFCNNTIIQSGIKDTTYTISDLDYFKKYFWRIGVKFEYGNIVYSDINNFNTGGPQSFFLMQNYPNPFNNETLIEFELPYELWVQLNVYNMLGQLITVLEDNEVGAGKHIYKWDGKNLPSGIYFICLKTKDFSNTKKALLLR